MQRIEKPILLIVFGASGDLARRKLIPALYHLAYQNSLPSAFTLLGFARTEYTDEEFRQLSKEGVQEFGESPFDERVWNRFAQGLFYQGGAIRRREKLQSVGEARR